MLLHSSRLLDRLRYFFLKPATREAFRKFSTLGEGEPADVDHAPGSALTALAVSTYPKLLFVGDPGVLVSPAYAADFAARLRHIAVVPLGSGRHNLQEDHPEAIGRSVAGWIAGIEAATARHHLQAA